MRVIAELFRRFVKAEDPRKKECTELAAQLRDKMEGFLGDSNQISFSLTGEQARRVYKHWQLPVDIGIERKLHDLRFESSIDILGGEVLVLEKDNKLRVFDRDYRGKYSGVYVREGLVGHLVFGFDGLDNEMVLLREWLGVATRLEGLQKNPQTVSAVPSAT